MPNSRVCGYCKEEKIFNWTGKKMSDGGKLYTDESGSRWSGRRCPDCERSRVQAAVKFDPFEKNLLVQQIESQGYKVNSVKDIITAEKEGHNFTFQARRGATTKDGQILLEGQNRLDTDFTIILFQSTRICSKEQIEKLAPSTRLFTAPVIPRPRKEFAKREERIFSEQGDL